MSKLKNSLLLFLPGASFKKELDKKTGQDIQPLPFRAFSLKDAVDSIEKSLEKRPEVGRADLLNIFSDIQDREISQCFERIEKVSAEISTLPDSEPEEVLTKEELEVKMQKFLNDLKWLVEDAKHSLITASNPRASRERRQTDKAWQVLVAFKMRAQKMEETKESLKELAKQVSLEKLLAVVPFSRRMALREEVFKKMNDLKENKI